MISQAEPRNSNYTNILESTPRAVGTNMGTMPYDGAIVVSGADPAIQLLLLAIRGLSPEQRAALLSMLFAEGGPEG